MFIIMNYVCSTMENFKKLAGERDVVLFGAGEGCMRFLNRMDSSSLQSVKYILTNNRRKIGGALYGIPIASLICCNRWMPGKHWPLSPRSALLLRSISR